MGAVHRVVTDLAEETVNYFVMLNGCTYCLASCYSLWQGRYLWAIVWVSYGASALVLSVLEK